MSKKQPVYVPDQDSPDFERKSLPPVDPTVYNVHWEVETMQNNIREIRTRKGISIRQLEKLTGIPRSTLSKVERGRQELYPGWKVRIEKALEEEVNVTNGKQCS